ESVHEYFDMKPNQESPYMLLVAPVHERLRTDDSASDVAAFGIEKLNQIRSQIPAVTHVDNSARVQTVDCERNPLLAKLLTAFEQRTGVPVLINTSFNVRSEPIVCTPQDAIRCFMMTDMDVLVLGHFVLLKSEQTSRPDEASRSEHLQQFGLD
ncbi:MAG: hypothetical protein KDA69_07240, partial [Planctomycetaceae bacterium]|nr:hypothetical protein [Planctomycetaceae bacterium]